MHIALRKISLCGRHRSTIPNSGIFYPFALKLHLWNIPYLHDWITSKLLYHYCVSNIFTHKLYCDFYNKNTHYYFKTNLYMLLFIAGNLCTFLYWCLVYMSLYLEAKYLFLAVTKQLCAWYFLSVLLSVRLSVRLSVCLSVCLSHIFDYVPIIVSSWNFQELSPRTR